TRFSRDWEFRRVLFRSKNVHKLLFSSCGRFGLFIQPGQFTFFGPFQYISRERNFCSLPVAVFGSASTNLMDFGALKCAILSRVRSAERRVGNGGGTRRA